MFNNKMRENIMQHVAGYQLIEMMLVIAIISILATSALPNYTQHLSRTHRLEAQRALLELAVELENYQIKRNSYRDATFTTLGINEYTNGNRYKLSFQVTDMDYQLTATPQNSQKDNDECGRLTLNASGQKGAENDAHIKDCWR
jgi:type IV pilus assembly protein PilE